MLLTLWVLRVSVMLCYLLAGIIACWLEWVGWMFTWVSWGGIMMFGYLVGFVISLAILSFVVLYLSVW